MCYQLFLTNLQRQKFHSNWYKLQWFKLDESSHIYQIGHNKKPYNYTIENIADNIINHLYNYTSQLYSDNSDEYECYEYITPFNNTPSLNAISKLKIYVQFVDDIQNENIFIIASNLDSEYESEFNPDVLPLYKSVGTTVQVVSIIMNLYNPTKDFIISALHHEIRHALDYIADKKLTSLSNKLNYAVDAFLDLYNKSPKMLRPIYNFAYNCAYYTQDTEIKGHLENAYYELLDSGISREDILKLCRILTYVYNKNNIINKIDNNILEILPTLDNYLLLLIKVRNYIEYPGSLIFNKDISDLILDIVYHESVLERPFKTSVLELLKKWERQLMKFIKLFTKAVYLHYQINEAYSL